MKTVNFPIPIIGLKGKASAGKSTGARYLGDLGYVRLNFAAPIRAMLRGLGLNDEELNGSLKESPCRKLGGMSPRVAMQTIGGAMRAVDEDFFVKIWRASAADLLMDCQGIATEDCRYPNEADVIRSFGGIVIEVQNPNVPESVGIVGHESEKQDFEPDVIALNDGADLEAFHASIDDAIAVLLEPAFDDFRLAA